MSAEAEHRTLMLVRGGHRRAEAHIRDCDAGMVWQGTARIVASTSSDDYTLGFFSDDGECWVLIEVTRENASGPPLSRKPEG